MPRPKSAFRQRLTYRHLRWALWRTLPGRIGPLARWLNFYLRGVFPADVADEAIESTSITVNTEFTQEQRNFVRDRCHDSDADSSPSDGSGTAVFILRTHVVRDVEVLGHTGAVALPRHPAVIWSASGPPSRNMVKPRKLQPIGPVAGRAVAVSGTDNYFHFMMNDMLPLIDYLDRLHPADTPLSIIVPRPPHAFATQTLEALARAYPGVEIVRVAKSEKIAVHELVALERRTANREWFVWDPAVVGRLKKILFAHLPVDADRSVKRRLFVLRDGTRIRRLLNEEELIRVAEARGFETFTPHAGNFVEQLRLFDGASTVVSVHGAALTNLMWCRPGTQAFEIVPSNFIKSTFLYLSDRMDVRYDALIGSRGNSELAFTLHPDRFARALDKLTDGATCDAVLEPADMQYDRRDVGRLARSVGNGEHQDAGRSE